MEINRDGEKTDTLDPQKENITLPNAVVHDSLRHAFKTNKLEPIQQWSVFLAKTMEQNLASRGYRRNAQHQVVPKTQVTRAQIHHTLQLIASIFNNHNIKIYNILDGHLGRLNASATEADAITFCTSIFKPWTWKDRKRAQIQRKEAELKGALIVQLISQFNVIEP
jgi:hypothetical protein